MKTVPLIHTLIDRTLCRTLLALLLTTTALRAEGPGVPEAGVKRQWNQQERREQRLQEFLREHSDPSGQPRPDLWLKGIQDTKQMKVAGRISVWISGTVFMIFSFG